MFSIVIAVGFPRKGTPQNWRVSRGSLGPRRGRRYRYRRDRSSRNNRHGLGVKVGILRKRFLELLQLFSGGLREVNEERGGSPDFAPTGLFVPERLHTDTKAHSAGIAKTRLKA